MGVYIPEKRLKNLHTYAYSGADDSIISKVILGPYWNWLVTLVPTSIAPNTLTVSGLALVFLNFITLVYVDPGLDCAGAKLRPGYDARGPSDILAPVHVLPRFGYPKDAVAADEGNEGRCLMPWVFLTWSLCLFAYQSLDSIDGKQARRTGMAGPLGELFDHGCDAINTTLECLLACAALNVGKSYWSIAALVATLSNFYLTTWEEFHTGTLYLSAFSGPVEGILMICLVYLITGLAPQGARFWDRGILSVTGLETIPSIAKSYSRYNFALNDAFLTFGAVGLFANVVASYSNVVKARRANKRDPISPLLGLAPLVILLVCLWTWSTARGAAVLRDGQAYVALVCAFGLMFAYTVGLLIVAHVTKAPFPYFNVALGWAILGALDSAAEHPVVQNSKAGTRTACYFVLVFSFLLYGHFCYDVITTITKETGKPCFWVPKDVKPAVVDGKTASTSKSSSSSSSSSSKPKKN